MQDFEHQYDLLAEPLVLRGKAAVREGGAMSARLDKMKEELARLYERRAKLNERIQKAEEKYHETENTEIQEMVHLANLGPDQLSIVIEFAKKNMPVEAMENLLSQEEIHENVENEAQEGYREEEL